MAKTRLFAQLQQLLAVAQHCERSGEPTVDALQRLRGRPGRRSILKTMAGLGGAALLPAYAIILERDG